MKRVLFAITIDVEVDKSMDWRIPSNTTFKSVEYGIPSLLFPIFEDKGAKPTFLLSPEVLESEACIKVLKTLRRCELGTHLHGDLIEPNRSIKTLAGSFIREMQCSYPKDVEFRKLEHLTETFHEKFGIYPKSFRAGRFGARGYTITCLERLGYFVDSSVTPGIDHNYPEGRANFANAPIQPYYPDNEDITKPGRSSVLEVPVTILSSKFKLVNSILFPKPLNKFVGRFFRAHWLRPSFETLDCMKKVCDVVVKRSRRDIVVLNLMFHSIEVIPSASPYTRSVGDIQLFLTKIKDILNYVVERGWEFATLSEVYQTFKGKRFQ